ncbi:hypothetical protein FACS189491_06120 [Spirochaetia bacterium]|nr:hypothetical protein FACS189491_06120 [Spirochaetia bacterium]
MLCTIFSEINDYRVAYNFSSYREGIRAHIQHLKGYATKEALKNACVDPRYYRIEQEYGWGSVPTVYDLSDKWARGNYGNEINAILTRMYQ